MSTMEPDKHTDSLELDDAPFISIPPRRRARLSSHELRAQGKLFDLMSTVNSSRLDGRSQGGFTMLHHAAKENRTDIIDHLVKSGCDINAEDNEKQAPLHKAAMLGNFESVKLLLDSGADISHQDIHGHTPLHTAIVSGGDIRVVKEMITKADVRVKDNDDQNVLHAAVRYHKVDVIDLILDHEQASDLIATGDKDGFTPLHLAVSLGYLDTVDTFLTRQKPDICQTTKEGKNIIHLAAATCNADILPFLLDMPTALHLINEHDMRLPSPLHYAARNGNLRQVIMLMDRGARFCTTAEGYSPLHYACQSGHLSVAKKILERHSFQIAFLTNNEDTALHVAARNGHAAIVKLLLDNGIPVTHNLQKSSFLDIALLNRDSKVALEAVKHERWQECLDLVSPVHPSPMVHLVQVLPDVAKLVLDHSITSAHLHHAHPNYWKHYDFKYLLDASTSKPVGYNSNTRWCGIWLLWSYIYRIFTVSNDSKVKEFKVIRTMLEYNRSNLFIHPLLLTFINLKWRNYGRLVVQIRASFLTLLVLLLTTLIAVSDPPRFSVEHGSTANSSDVEMKHQHGLLVNATSGDVVHHLAIVNAFVNIAYIAVIVIEIIIFIRSRRIFHIPLTLAEFSTIVFTAIFTQSDPINWMAGVAALLCAWIALNLFSRYFDVFGLYTIMFYDLLFSVVKAILVGLYYIIGFGLIMYILVGEELLYESPWVAIYSTFFTVINGFDIGILAEKEAKGTLQYTKTTYVMVLIMAVVLSVTLMNLLIGIAVGSIDAIQKNALTYQTKLKIELFLEIDPNIPMLARDTIVPKYYTRKTSKLGVINFIRRVWNYMLSYFANDTEDEGNEDDEKVDEYYAKIDDMSYRIAQMERQIETALKHQQMMMAELKQ